MCIRDRQKTITITEPPVLAATTSQVDVKCFGATTGSATVSVSGGTGTYTYLWSPSGGTGATASGLGAGSHSVVVKDANGCSFTTSASVSNSSGPTAVVLTAVDATCGQTNGSFTIGAVTGGVAPYTYSVDGSAFTTTTTYPGLGAGSHSVVVKDANGCSFTTSASVSNSSGPTAVVLTAV